MDCNQLELSIIIPVYNMEQYVGRCLDSVVEALRNMGKVVEVLIINDGSTDSSEEIIKKYCNEYSYMKLYNKKNGGLSDVKNYGLERAKGRYVIFLDSDDYIEPEMYESMLEKAKKENADIVVCDIQLTYDDKSKNIVWPCTVNSRSGIFEQVIDMTMMPASWNKMVRRELYSGITFPVGKNNEDIAVTPIILAKAKKISVINRPFYKYYQRIGSIQNSNFSEKRFVILDTAKICMERLKEVDLNKHEAIKGSVYLHQVLSLAMYPIRREKIISRYKLLKKYMFRIESLFPDIWENKEIEEFVHWDTPWVQLSRRISIFLLKRKQYLIVSVFWSPCNILYDCSLYVTKKAMLLKEKIRRKE